MTDKCTRCSSYAINHHCHGRDGSDANLCDVCYWRKRAEDTRLIRNAALEEAAVKCDALSDDLYEESVRRNVQDDLIAKQCAAAIRSLKEEA